MRTLRDRLLDWIDIDCAAYELAVVLGVIEQEFGAQEGVQGDPWHGHKGMFWSDNPVGNALYASLKALAEAGVLEYNSEDMQYRWSQGMSND